MIEQRARENSNLPVLHSFSTTFYPKLLTTKGSLHHWTRNVNIFDNQLILWPIHTPGHWSLVVLHMQSGTLKLLDSYRADRRVLENVLTFCKKEWRLKMSEPIPNWQTSIEHVPKQENRTDCGVFLCHFAECLSRRASITPADMSKYRRIIAHEIVSGKLL